MVSLKTFFKNNKRLLIGLLMGMFIVFPFTFSGSYERLDVEVFMTTNDLLYGSFYDEYFNETITLPNDDIALIYLMNITEVKIVLIDVSFTGDVDILRLGIINHETDELIYDSYDPVEGVTVQIHLTMAGLYSCGVFFSANGQYSVSTDIVYLI